MYEIPRAANQDWGPRLGTLGRVWQYYKLVMTQWPEFGFDPYHDAAHAVCSGRGVPAPAVVNTTMETFPHGLPQYSATTDFIWSIPMNAKQIPD